METTDSKSADKKRYAISTKAYNYFVERIRNTLEDMYYCACEEALELLDAAVGYDNDDPIDIMDCEIEAQVAFSMIEPEIERAIKRSQAARERAARRKSMAAAETVAPNAEIEKSNENAMDCNMEQPSVKENALPALPEIRIPQHCNKTIPIHGIGGSNLIDDAFPRNIDGA
jgi:hypothetical protein